FQNPFNQITGARLTVFEEVAFGLENLGVLRDEMVRRVQAVLERLKIGHLAERSPYALSGGQQQRVAIASILVLAPQVLVMDEPTAQLDPVGTGEVMDVLADLAEAGASVVLATHKLAQAAPFAQSALLLEEGRLVRHAAAAEVLADPLLDELGVERPAPARLAQHLGLPPLWPVTVEDGLPYFRAALRSLPAPESGGDRSSAPRWAPGGQAGGASDRTPHPTPQPLPSLLHPHPTPVALDEVHFTYPSGVEALRGVSLSLEPGAITTLIGENGAGKTTLSKLINGLLRPTAGRVRVGDWLAADHPVSDLAHRVGYVFQNPDEQLFKSTVWDEVAFGPRNLGLTGRRLQQAVTRALELTGLTAAAEVHPYDLQLAERRWVAIASVLAMEPPVIILDEPTTGQDRRGRERLARLLDRLRVAGHTLLAITHDMDFAAEQADLVAMMADGRVLTVGPPGQVFADATLLRQAGLESPPVARLAHALSLGSQIVTEAQFVAAWAGRWE
ncbi:MAG TPA: ABC transporter, partial [Chloroflexi bacterium]|nr:ABC transporter [Chloroflexota bacterium]